MSKDRYATLHQTAGEALHMGQVLELNLGILIDLVNRGRGSFVDARKLIVEENKKTLGQLVAELRKRATVSAETEHALSAALEARNYIAHDFFLRVVDAFTNDSTHQQAMELLKGKAKQVAIGAAITQGFVQGLTEHLGGKMADVLIRQDI